STKPMERRAIIEEAAGVTKFKTKKRLAEAKLESSKVNLARVNDIVVEVEKQLGSLKRQAAKARRYSEIREQMRGIVRQMLAGKARELDAAAETITKQLQEARAQATEWETRSATQVQAVTLLGEESGALNGRVEELLQRAEQRAAQIRDSEGRIEALRQRASEAGESLLRLHGEQKQSEE